VPESSGADLNNIYKGLVDAFSDTLAWEWDDRFGGVLAAFKVSEKDRVQSIINKQLSQIWESSSIDDAPENIGNAIQNFGGLNPSQLLFTTSQTQEVMLLGLWWPWGNGETISIRFVPYGVNSSDAEKESMQAKLKACFGL